MVFIPENATTAVEMSSESCRPADGGGIATHGEEQNGASSTALLVAFDVIWVSGPHCFEF